MNLFVSDVCILDKYSDVKKLCDNVFFAIRNDYYDEERNGVIIDSTGKQIVPGFYNNVIRSYNGKEFVVRDSTWCIVIDRSGEKVLKGYYKDIMFYSDGLYLVEKDNSKYYLVDREEKPVSKPLFSYPFAKSGYTYRDIENPKIKNILGSKDSYSYKPNLYEEKYIICNKDGEQIVPGEYRSIISSDGERYSVLTLDNFLGMYRTYKIIKKDGTEIKFDGNNEEVIILGGGLFAVRTSWPNYKVVDINNHQVFPNEYSKFKSIDGQIFGVCDCNSLNSYYLLNKYGEKIDPDRFEVIKQLDGNMYGVKKDSYETAPIKVIDSNGKRIEGFYGFRQHICFNDKLMYFVADTEEELREKVHLELQKIRDSLVGLLSKVNNMMKMKKRKINKYDDSTDKNI